VAEPKAALEGPRVEVSRVATVSLGNNPDKPATDKQKQIVNEKPKPAVTATSTSAKKEERAAKKEEPKSETEKSQAKVYSIVVVAQIENGHVTEAWVTNHKAGLDAYEATAIRLARQRRFAKDKTGTERIVLTVSDK
jgi:hypothetical protein